MDKPNDEIYPAPSSNEICFINCDLILPDPARSPVKYSDDELSRLARRFLKRGIGIPSVVRRIRCDNGEKYLLVSGEKIFRAALIAGSVRIPCIVLPDVLPNTQEENDLPLPQAQSPPKASSRIVIHDSRLFFNSVNHAVKLMRQSGVNVVCERDETPLQTVLVITVPKSPPI